MNSRIQAIVCAPQMMIAIKHADVTLRRGYNQQGEAMVVIEVHPQPDIMYGRWSELLLQEAVLISSQQVDDQTVFSFKENLEEIFE